MLSLMTDSSIPPGLLGGTRHPMARDLTRYVTHMTPTAENLVNIITQGRIEARNPFGMARKLFMPDATQCCACFAGVPVNEIGRLSRGPFGVGFKASFLRDNGGQRVWYLDDGEPRNAIADLMDRAVAAKAWDSPLWKLTPFIDKVIPRMYEFEWEREWRVPGGVTFSQADIAFIVAPSDDGEVGIVEALTLGFPLIDPKDGSVSWTGASLEALNEGIQALLRRFHETYVTPEEAAVPFGSYSSYEGEWQSMFHAVSYDDAINELFDDLAPHTREKLAEAVLENGRWDWIRRADVNQIET